MRKIKEHTNGKHTAKVYKDTEYNEYQVQFYTDGAKVGTGYHTESKQDANETAVVELDRLKGLDNEHTQTITIDPPSWPTVLEYMLVIMDTHAKTSWNTSQGPKSQTPAHNVAAVLKDMASAARYAITLKKEVSKTCAEFQELIQGMKLNKVDPASINGALTGLAALNKLDEV